MEVEDFLADRSPEAFARVVDRLLASPAYGERWGRHWLDVARYADTKGYVFYYEETQFVQPFRYRDWVVRALNEDLPYDRFLTLQIAADQALSFPAEHGSRRAATIDPAWAKGHPDLAALGFVSLGRRFLGNPQDIIDDQLDVLLRGTQGLTITCARCHDHKFDPIAMTDYYGLYGVFQNTRERVGFLEDRPKAETTMTLAQAREYLEFEKGLETRVAKLESTFRTAADQVADRLREKAADYLIAALERDRLPTLSANVRPAPGDINPYNVREWDRFLTKRRGTEDPVFGLWFAFESIPAQEFSEKARMTVAEPTLAAKANPLVAGLFTNAPTSMTDVATRYGGLFTSIHRQWQAELKTAETNKTARPTALADAAAEQIRQIIHGPGSPVLAPPGAMVELDVHLYFDDPNRVALSKLQVEIEQWLDKAPGGPARTLILEDRADVSEARVFRRGDPTKPAEEAPRRFLTALGGSDSQRFREGSGRLELARAIASPENPLTARVMVNRVWSQHFGTGLVSTPSDFGTRSEPPSHPEMLDWLARRFIADGWSLKKLHRLILLSATYQQSSDVAAKEPGQLKDPSNRWLWAFPRQRLDFEALRDSMLEASGELDRRTGGRAFDLEARPIVPRRTLYARIDRKFLPPVLRSFDFANPDVHAPERHSTTVPQQALFLLNSEWLIDRARALARRAEESAASPEARIQNLYRFIHQRSPSPQELALGQTFLATAGQESELPPLAQYSQVLLLSNELAYTP